MSHLSLLLCLTLFTSALFAGSRQGHGVITEVIPGKEGKQPTIVIEGKFASHFSGQRFLPWQFRLNLVATGEKTGTYIYLVDGLLVPDHIGQQALRAGRRVSFSEDVISIQTNDEFSELGVIARVQDEEIVMTKLENAEPGYGRQQGRKDFSFSLDQTAQFLHDAKPVSRDAVVQVGNYVRLMGAVPQTINVIEAVEPIRSFPGAYKHSAWGTITAYDQEQKIITALIQESDGSVSERQLTPRKHVSLDGHYLPRTAADRFRWHAAFEPGRQAFFFCHRNSTDPNEVYIQSQKQGEIKGVIAAYTAEDVTVQTWIHGEIKEVKIRFEETARFRRNYLPFESSTVFKVGDWIHVRPSQPMRVMTGRWDLPIEMDQVPPPQPINLQGEAHEVGKAMITWDSNAGLGLPAISYQIIRDGVPVGTSSNGTFIDDQLTEETTYTYSVQALNRWGKQGEMSDGLRITTRTDTIPPRVTSVKAISETNSLLFRFSKPMDKSTLIEDNITILQADIVNLEVTDEGAGLIVRVDELGFGNVYDVSLKGLRDASKSANSLGEYRQVSVTAWPDLDISDLKSTSGKLYKVTTFEKGSLLYTDRNYRAQIIPRDLEGSMLIQTPLDEKKNDSNVKHSFSFTYNRPILIYIMLNARRLGHEYHGFKMLDRDRFSVQANTNYKAFAQDFIEPGEALLPVPVYGGRRPNMYWLLVQPIDP